MKPRTDVVVENAEGELIVLDKDGGKVHQLNQTASLIWSGLCDGLGTEGIAAQLVRDFQVELERAATDVRFAIEQFVELGLLEDLFGFDSRWVPAGFTSICK